MSPERALWAAVLSQAIDDATGGKLAYGEPKDRDQARAWIESNCRRFRTACDFAGVDPDWVRRKVAGRIAAAQPRTPSKYGPKAPWTSREIARARRLHAKGASYADIGRLLNRSSGAVWIKINDRRFQEAA